MIKAIELSKSYGKQTLFENISFNINKKERVGLVGRNGQGKTTLFRLLLRQEEIDSGTISIPKTYIIAHLDQHIYYTKDTVLNVGLSVSRVGSSAQTKAMKKVSGSMKLELAQYREMAAFAQFGSDLDASTQKLLNRGSKLTELLKQKQYSPMTVAEQVISVFCGVKGHLDDVEQKNIAEFENKIIEKCKSEKSEILDSIKSSGKLEEDMEKSLTEVITELKKNFKS